jgi:hypothetical protein
VARDTTDQGRILLWRSASLWLGVSRLRTRHLSPSRPLQILSSDAESAGTRRLARKAPADWWRVAEIGEQPPEPSRSAA